MTPRERIFAAINFEKTDRAPCDITEGRIWPDLDNYFEREHGLHNRDEILNFLDTDIRWIEPTFTNTDLVTTSRDTVSCSTGPLANAETVEEVTKGYESAYANFFGGNDTNVFCEIDYAAFRKKWPDHAVALIPFAVPYFWESCSQFGMDEVFFRIHDKPELYEALLKVSHTRSMRNLTDFIGKSGGCADILLLWDDVAGQNGMMVDPGWWRETIKPYLKKEVDFIHAHGLKVFYHSCGAVRPIIKDFIDIGIDVFTVFQANARDMEPGSIAREFGGRICFYGGMEVQYLLSYGSVAEVEAQVAHNLESFRGCGGYITANCHSQMDTIKGENIVAMCRAAKNFR